MTYKPLQKYHPFSEFFPESDDAYIQKYSCLMDTVIKHKYNYGSIKIDEFCIMTGCIKITPDYMIGYLNCNADMDEITFHPIVQQIDDQICIEASDGYYCVNPKKSNEPLKEWYGNFIITHSPFYFLNNLPDRIYGNFSIENCNELLNLNGLPSVVTGDITIENNKKLRSLKGLKIKRCENNLVIHNNHNLVNIEGCPKIVLGSLDCFNNNRLESIKGIAKYIGCDLNLMDCPLDDETHEILKTIKVEGDIGLPDHLIELDF